jgi:hypothetical protein
MKEIPQGSSSFKALNQHLFGPVAAPTASTSPEAPAKPPKRIRQSSKPLMNKLETEFHAELCSRFPDVPIRCQAMTLRLANGLRYTPDFVVFNHWLAAYEVKGPWIDGDSVPKLKMAAAMFPDVGFWLVWKDAGKWQYQQVLP